MSACFFHELHELHTFSSAYYHLIFNFLSQKQAVVRS